MINCESHYLLNSSFKIASIILYPVVGPQYREECWDIEQRGAVGENALHVCLLNASSIHADLAKRLLKHYPKLMNDIYISDEYYGRIIFKSQNQLQLLCDAASQEWGLFGVAVLCSNLKINF